MAHELAVRNGRAMMAYAGQTPWHGLGTKVAGLMTIDEALKEAQLDKQVVKEPAFFRAEDGTFKPTPNHFITRYEGESSVLGVVSKEYEVVQNAAAFNVMAPFVERSRALYETAGALGTGSLVWMLAKMPEELELKGDSPITQYVLFVNSHDASRRVSVVLTNVRVVCQNTMRRAFSDNAGNWSCRHVKNAAARLDNVAEDLGLKIKQQTDHWLSEANFLMSKQVTMHALNKYFDRLARPVNATAEDLQKPPSRAALRWADSFRAAYELEADRKLGSENSWWHAYNAATDAIDHSGNGLRGDAETRMGSMLFGDLGRRSDFARQLAMEAAAS